MAPVLMLACAPHATVLMLAPVCVGFQVLVLAPVCKLAPVCIRAPVCMGFQGPYISTPVAILVPLFYPWGFRVYGSLSHFCARLGHVKRRWTEFYGLEARVCGAHTSSNASARQHTPTHTNVVLNIGWGWGRNWSMCLATSMCQK